MERSEEDNFCNHSEDDDDYFQTSQEDSHVGSYRRSNYYYKWRVRAQAHICLVDRIGRLSCIGMLSW